jgi:hypothetical protein
MWRDVSVSFDRGEYSNEAVSTCGGKRVTKTDLNKSKLLGVYVGSKSKEFLKGFVFGNKLPSRHTSPDE